MYTSHQRNVRLAGSYLMQKDLNIEWCSL